MPRSRLYLLGGAALLAVAAAATALVTLAAPEGRTSGQKASTIPPLELVKVAEGFTQPTDVQFVPGHPQQVVVVEKLGTVQWLDLAGGARRQLLKLDVLSESEQGLLGLAFHPDFARNGRFYLSYVARLDGKDQSHIAEWRHPRPGDLSAGTPAPHKVVFTTPQPYQNHNGGQIVFGPDGLLYFGLGDGGDRHDPLGSGQDKGTLLGALLRIDIDRAEAGRAYGIPRDNPFVGKQGVRPELWAVGLRNPWRFSFLDDGRVVAADVGQGQYEEIDVIRAGDNLGWNVHEGFSCFKRNGRCGQPGFVPPVHVYGRELGQSVTGGHVYRGQRVPALAGHYVFADFVSGRFFAIVLPTGKPPAEGVPSISLGQWPVTPTAFARDAAGELYVAGFGPGALFRLEPRR